MKAAVGDSHGYAVPAGLLCSQALHVLHVALDKLGLVGATRVDPQVYQVHADLACPPVATIS